MDFYRFLACGRVDLAFRPTRSARGAACWAGPVGRGARCDGAAGAVGRGAMHQR